MAPTLDEFLGKKEKGGEEEESSRLALVPGEVLAELVERVARLEEKVEKLEEELQELKRRHASGRQRRAEEKEERGRPPSLFQKALDALNAKGYVSLVKDLSRRNPDELGRVLKRLEQMGGVVLEVEGDTLIVHPSVYREFREKLETVEERDPVACAELFGRAGKLFNELYRRGLLYYSSKESRWKML